MLVGSKDKGAAGVKGTEAEEVYAPQLVQNALTTPMEGEGCLLRVTRLPGSWRCVCWVGVGWCRVVYVWVGGWLLVAWASRICMFTTQGGGGGRRGLDARAVRTGSGVRVVYCEERDVCRRGEHCVHMGSRTFFDTGGKGFVIGVPVCTTRERRRVSRMESK